jgi:hypothetical protein
VVTSRPARNASEGHVAADLAHALRLAAEAGQWAVVEVLARQLEALRRDDQSCEVLRFVR